MQQIARNVTMEGCGALRDCRYLLHDRDTKYTQSFRAIIASGRVEPLVLPACSPNLNAYAERWVRSVKEECLCKVPIRSMQICRSSRHSSTGIGAGAIGTRICAQVMPHHVRRGDAARKYVAVTIA